MSTNLSPGKKFFSKKVPLSVTVAVCIACLIIIFVQYISGKSQKRISYSNTQPASTCDVKMTQLRLNEFEFTHPLLISDVNNQSESFLDLKAYLEALIKQKQNDGSLADAAVYFRKLATGEFISVNGGAQFMPGSLFKVPVLISYLKESEKNPRLLNKEIFSGTNNTAVLHQSYEEKLIDENRNYKVSELLEHMIVQSDNFATKLLLENMNVPFFQKLFADIGIEKPDIFDRNTTSSAVDIAKFFRLLYNSSYLSEENSEYALKLLSKTTFRSGILNQLPQGIKVVHKFGEGGALGEKQLHEAAIIYTESCTYILVLMTKGNTVNTLSPVMSEISKYVYDYLISSSKAI